MRVETYAMQLEVNELEAKLASPLELSEEVKARMKVSISLIAKRDC